MWVGRGTLLGPEKSGAGPIDPICGWWTRLLVFLWLFGCWIVDASIFVAVCSDRIDRSSLVEGRCFRLFCCVCVCGDKL